MKQEESGDDLAELVRRAFNAPVDPIEQFQRDVSRTQAERQAREDEANQAMAEHTPLMAQAILDLVEENKRLVKQGDDTAKMTRWVLIVALTALVVSCVGITIGVLFG